MAAYDRRSPQALFKFESQARLVIGGRLMTGELARAKIIDYPQTRRKYAARLGELALLVDQRERCA